MKIQDSEFLRRSSVFRFVSDEHFDAIEPLLEEEHYEFGDVIVKQGDPANSFYVLTRGRARALKIKPGGEEIPLGVLKPGDSFGEAALAEGGTRNATVRCSTAVDVLRIDDRVVRQVLVGALWLAGVPVAGVPRLARPAA